MCVHVHAKASLPSKTVCVQVNNHNSSLSRLPPSSAHVQVTMATTPTPSLSSSLSENEIQYEQNNPVPPYTTCTATKDFKGTYIKLMWSDICTSSILCWPYFFNQTPGYYFFAVHFIVATTRGWLLFESGVYFIGKPKGNKVHEGNIARHDRCWFVRCVY